MDDKKAMDILRGLLDKYPLNKEEQEAVRSAVGTFSWTSLSKSRIRAIKNKRDKDVRW